MDLSVARVTAKITGKVGDAKVEMGVPRGGYTREALSRRRDVECEVQARQKTTLHFLECYRKGRRFRTQRLGRSRRVMHVHDVCP